MSEKISPGAEPVGSWADKVYEKVQERLKNEQSQSQGQPQE